MLIVYCDTCGLRLSEKDLSSGGAVQLEENKYLCKKCLSAAPVQPAPSATDSKARLTPGGVGLASAPAGSTSRKSGTVVLPQRDLRSSKTNLRVPPKPASGPSALPDASAKHGDTTTGVYVPDVERPNPKNKMLLPLIIGAAGLVVFLIGVVVVLMRGGEKPPEPPVANNDNTDKPAVPVVKKADKPSSDANAPALPSWMREAAREKAGPALADPKAKPAPGQDAEKKSEPEKKIADEQPAAEPKPAFPAATIPAGETAWFEDNFPPGAKQDPSGHSWHWVKSSDGPVASGERSHASESGALSQHLFIGANPPLLVGREDTLYSYVFLDPKNPPKEIMLKFHLRGNWEHRAYWGEDLMNAGQNFSPSRLPMGALPKTGEWVRLEVPAAQIGVESDNEPIDGWGFASAEGKVYWDHSGAQHSGKTPAVTQNNPPPQPTNTPAVQAMPEGYIAVAKIGAKQFKGGQDYWDFNGKRKNTKAIWAKTTPKNAFSASFDAPDKRYAAGRIVILSLMQGRGPCKFCIKLNGQEIFNAPDKATRRNDLNTNDYSFPDGLLKGGKNELEILNTEDRGNLNQEPWYMVSELEIQCSLMPDFPPVIADGQRTAWQVFEGALAELGKKDIDPTYRLDGALRVLKGASADAQKEPGIGRLASAIEKSLALQKQAIENMKKKPPPDTLTIEKMKNLKGVISKIDGGKAYIKSQGMEIAVDLNQVPQALFYKALALDETTPDGMASKAAWQLGSGKLEDVQQVLAKMKKEQRPAWAAFYDDRAALERVIKFDGGVDSAMQAAKAGNAEALKTAVEALKKDYPDFCDQNKERMAWLTSRAEAAKK
ncbi:MAG TPA: hypothetical protein VGP72_06920 [Planctomycetota bacterium]|jgi:hypothetical protein